MTASDNAQLGTRWWSGTEAGAEPRSASALHEAQAAFRDQIRSMFATPDAKDDRPANIELAGRIDGVQSAARQYFAR